MTRLEDRKRRLEKELSEINIALQNKKETEKTLKVLKEKLDLIKKLVPNFKYEVEINDYHGKIVLTEHDLCDKRNYTSNSITDNQEILEKVDYILKNIDKSLNAMEKIKSQLETDDNYMFYLIPNEFKISKVERFNKIVSNITIRGNVDNDLVSFRFMQEHLKTTPQDADEHIYFNAVEFYKSYTINNGDSLDLEDYYYCDIKNLEIDKLKDKRAELTELVRKDSKVFNHK